MSRKKLRSVMINVRVTEHDAKRVTKAYKKAGFSVMSEWVRAAIFAHIDRGAMVRE